MNKIQSILESRKAKVVIDTIKTAAVNIAVGVVVVGVATGAKKLVEVAADAVSKESQQI